jgi:BTB/POZ domain
MAAVTFNVGGKEFKITRELVYKSSKLTQLVEGDFRDEVIFLDHNYEAFSVILDFLRYDRILLPPTVSAMGVEIVFDSLKIPLSSAQRNVLTESLHTDKFDPQGPPLYNQVVDEDGHTFSLSDTKGGKSDSSSLPAQLAVTVHQKIADLIITTIRPCITSQVRTGAYRTTYILLPTTLQQGSMMSEFPQSNFTEMVYLEPDVERFLRQTEVLERFEDTLKESLKVPMTMAHRDIFFRSENEYGVYGTITAKALVIEFELGK